MKIILVDAVNTFVIEGSGIFKEMHELLETYENKKVILTNADDEQLKSFGLDQTPYEVFTLKHNPEKTDPLFFSSMLKHFGLSNDDVVYFEHNPKAVESAQSVGIVSYHYDPQQKDILALKAFLDASL